MFFGVNMFWVLLRAHFSPRCARAKMSPSRAQNIFTPLNINYIVILMSNLTFVSCCFWVVAMWHLIWANGVIKKIYRFNRSKLTRSRFWMMFSWLLPFRYRGFGRDCSVPPSFFEILIANLCGEYLNFHFFASFTSVINPKRFHVGRNSNTFTL